MEKTSPGLHLENIVRNKVLRLEKLDAHVIDFVQAIEPAFLHPDRDVGALSRTVHVKQRNAELAAAHVADVDLVTDGVGREVALVLVVHTRQFDVLLQFRGVVGLGEDILEEDGVRHAYWPQIPHGADQGAAAECLIALDLDVPHLHLGPFVHPELQLEGSGRHGSEHRVDCGELTPALRQVLLENHLGPLDLAWIVCGLDRQSHFPLLEAVQDFRGADRFDPRILDGENNRAFSYDETNDLSGCARLDLQAEIVETAGIPKRHEIPLKRTIVYLVALLGEDQRPEGVLRDPSGPPKLDEFDHVLNNLRLGRLDGRFGCLEGRGRRLRRGLGRRLDCLEGISALSWRCLLRESTRRKKA